jgi:hypothetical protein
VSCAEVQFSLEILGLLTWPGTSFCVLGLKVLSDGAVPAGRVAALNSGRDCCRILHRGRGAFVIDGDR